MRYCEMCDAWVRQKECPKCGADTVKAPNCYQCDGDGYDGIKNCPRCGGGGKERHKPMEA